MMNVMTLGAESSSCMFPPSSPPVGSIVSIASQSKRGDVSATHPEGREEVSVFNPEADMSGVEADVRYVPLADIGSPARLKI